MISTVPADLIFRDLFAYDRGSLAWLRVYKCNPQGAVALVLSPTDNPGTSPSNAAEQLLEDLGRAFESLGQLRVLVRFPDDPRGDGWTEIHCHRTKVDFERRSADEVEALIGSSILETDLADATCAGLGGEDHPLLRLIPPPEEEIDPLDRMAVVAVADLPWAHNPSSCHWKDRFGEFEALYPPGRQGRPAVGANWFLSLTKADFAACTYHEGDWKRVAAVAVEVFESLDQDEGVENAMDAAGRALGHSTEAHWCASLFSDPITWHPGQPSIVNGQHRTCALKASGAPLCVVNVAGAFVEEPRPADPRRRAAAEVSSFWAREAAG